MCAEGTTFGCHGNDTEAFCAPAVPARITGATGRLEGNVFYVETLDFADSPRDEGIFHEVE